MIWEWLAVLTARKETEQRIADAKKRGYPSVDEELARRMTQRGLSAAD